MAADQGRRFRLTVKKELERLEKLERQMELAALRQTDPGWRTALEEKVPQKVRANLQKAFCKAFSVVFEQGSGWIEKTYDKEELQKDHKIHNYAVQIKRNKKELRRMYKNAGAADLRNMAVTTAEGAGLGL